MPDLETLPLGTKAAARARAARFFMFSVLRVPVEFGKTQHSSLHRQEIEMHKLLICAAALMFSFGAGTAAASGQSNSLDRPITSSPGGTHGDSDGECEQIGSNMWSCWACEESGDQTRCESWFQTDDGEEFYREPGTREPPRTRTP